MKLSVANTIYQAMDTIHDHFKFFLAVSLLLFVCSAALEVIALQLVYENNKLLFLGLGIVGMALYVKQAVIVHRTVLKHEADRWDKVFSWGGPENQFLLITLGLWLLFSLSVGIVGGLSAAFIQVGPDPVAFQRSLMVILVPLMLLAGIIFSRISLIFPSRAVGKKMSTNTSIALTQGNSISLFVLLILLPVAMNLVIKFLLSEDVLIYNLLISFIAHLLVVFQVSVLSHVYMTLTSELEGAAANDGSNDTSMDA